MSTAQRQWKAAANLNLLLESDHPPARLEKSAQDSKSRDALTPKIDARNTVDFRTTSYCGLQSIESPTCFRALCEYYRAQLRRIPIWQAYDTTQPDGVKGGLVGDAVKREPNDEDVTPGRSSGRSSYGTAVYRAIGILTHVHEPSTLISETQAPWELHVISDMSDDSSFTAAFEALRADTAAATKAAQSAKKPGVKRERQSEGGADDDTPNPLLDDDDDERQRADLDGSRLSLYTRLAEAFTGVYPGMAIGVIGEPFQRSRRGVLTGVLVRRLVLPSRPHFPWRVDRPVPALATIAQPLQRSLRMHFCSGPYPRQEVKEVLRTITTQALHRGADLLIVGGPLVKPYADHEKDILPTVQVTFAEQLESFLDLFEDTLDNYYASRPLLTRMKVLLVSHRDDVTQVPVLPTTMYAIADSDSILLRSNPCRLSINGVHVGISTEDTPMDMRRTMLERWSTQEGSLRRVVEAMVQSRLYAPLMKLPSPKVDLRHLRCLYLDTLPPWSSHSSSTPEGDASNWGMIFPTKSSESHGVKQDASRVKEEERTAIKREGGEAVLQNSGSPLDAENAPHILFTPSSLPPFAHVTHRGQPDSSLSTVGSVLAPDECPLDETASATGVLVVNQGTWTQRAGSRFELRVAEITIKDTAKVAYCGASPANGVACGILHVFKDMSQ